MKTFIKCSAAIVLILLMAGACKKNDYKMGSLSAPSDVVINTSLVGQDADHPYGDGSGDVVISLAGKNVLSYRIAYEANPASFDVVTGNTVTHTFTKDGVNSYRITVLAYGAGAAVTTVTKDIEVRSDFKPEPYIVTDLIGSGTKTWSVNKDVPGHLGVGPWSPTSITPEWWSASVNEKVACCNCFYTASFTFSEVSEGTYSLTVATPDGAFTKTGALAGGLPGIPSTGDEGCYSYAGGTSAFSFVRPTSGVDASATTGTTISLSGLNTFIGYGATKKEYEILSITENDLYLRVQGTETGNAWYLKLKAD